MIRVYYHILLAIPVLVELSTCFNGLTLFIIEAYLISVADDAKPGPRPGLRSGYTHLAFIPCVDHYR